MALETLNNRYDIRHFDEGGTIDDQVSNTTGALQNQGTVTVQGADSSFDNAQAIDQGALNANTTASVNTGLDPTAPIKTGSTEAISNWYKTTLGRDPDQGGLAYWSGKFGDALTPDELAILNSSQEAQNRSFLTNLYKTETGREYDQGGYDFWSNALNSGTSRADIEKAFNESQEGTKYDIKNLYKDVLGREPDEAGLQSWYNAVDQGIPRDQILNSFKQSPEYEVAEDYQTYLGRTPDVEGGKYWMQQLQSGVPPQDIARAIALSQESITFNSPSVTALLESTLGKDIVSQLTPEQITEYTKLVVDPGRVNPTRQFASRSEFDPKFYIAKNPDVVAAGWDPYEHYKQYGYNEGRAANDKINFATQDDNLREVYRQIALDPVLGAKLKAENPELWEQVTPLTERPDELVRTDRTSYGQYGNVTVDGVNVPILSAKRADEILGRDNSGTVSDFSHSRGNLTSNLGWSTNSFSGDLSRGANALGVTSIVDPETGQVSYSGVNEAAALVGIDPTKFKDKQVPLLSTEVKDEYGNVIQTAGQPVYQKDNEGNTVFENGQPVPAMQTITAESQIYDAISEASKNLYRYTGDSLTAGRAVEGGAQSFDTVFYKRVGDELIPISKPVSHGGQQNADVYRPKDYGFAYYAQGPAFVAAAALSFAMADPSLSLATAVGSALLPVAASTAIGATATGIVGATVLGAAAGALSSTAGGADPGKGALTGAVTGLVASSMKPLLASESVLKATESIANASQGVFSQAQVGNIIGATIASTLASAASGANGDQILNSFKTSLISSGLSEKAAQLAVAGVKEAFGDDPKTLARTAAATRLVTRTASTAALSGKNPEQIQAAVIATLVQNAANIANAGSDKKIVTKDTKADTNQSSVTTAGLTQEEYDLIQNQGGNLAPTGSTLLASSGNTASDVFPPLTDTAIKVASGVDPNAPTQYITDPKTGLPMPVVSVLPTDTGGANVGVSNTDATSTSIDAPNVSLDVMPTAKELADEAARGQLPTAEEIANLGDKMSPDVAKVYLDAIAKYSPKEPGSNDNNFEAINTASLIVNNLLNAKVTRSVAIGTSSKVTGVSKSVIDKALSLSTTGVTGTTVVKGSGTGTTGTTGTGSGVTGTGTGAGTTGTGTGGGGTGTGTGGSGVDIGITGTGGTGTGGTGTGGGGGGTKGTGGGGVTTQKNLLPMMSAFMPQEYGGIQNLAPGLTGGGNYSLSGTPSTNTNMNPIAPNSPLQQFAPTSPVSPLQLGTPQQPNQPIQLADGGSTTQKAYNPYDISSGISGSLTPGLTKARLDYLLTGLPQNKAEGGSIEGHNPQFFSEGGLGSMENTFVEGDGDGTSDQVPAMLANGEFVIPADVVSGLGNGSNDAGAEVLQEFLKAIREHKHSAKADKLPPESKGPLAYLTNAKRKVKVA